MAPKPDGQAPSLVQVWVGHRDDIRCSRCRAVGIDVVEGEEYLCAACAEQSWRAHGGHHMARRTN